MATNVNVQLESFFPGLASSPYKVTSPSDPTYNCIAWAAGDSKRWWWPDPMGAYHWPPSVPREESLSAYQRAFESLGYAECNTEVYEEGFIKVALFAKTNVPKHASRQLSYSLWTSKLGQNVDISHELHSLSGDSYGQVAKILRRPKRDKD